MLLAGREEVEKLVWVHKMAAHLRSVQLLVLLPEVSEHRPPKYCGTYYECAKDFIFCLKMISNPVLTLDLLHTQIIMYQFSMNHLHYHYTRSFQNTRSCTILKWLPFLSYLGWFKFVVYPWDLNHSSCTVRQIIRLNNHY